MDSVQRCHQPPSDCCSSYHHIHRADACAAAAAAAWPWHWTEEGSPSWKEKRKTRLGVMSPASGVKCSFFFFVVRVWFETSWCGCSLVSDRVKKDGKMCVSVSFSAVFRRGKKKKIKCSPQTCSLRGAADELICPADRSLNGYRTNTVAAVNFALIHCLKNLLSNESGSPLPPRTRAEPSSRHPPREAHISASCL